MRLKRHDNRNYQPSTDAQRAAELNARNVGRILDYFERYAQHRLAQSAARHDRQRQLRRAYVDRRAV